MNKEKEDDSLLHSVRSKDRTKSEVLYHICHYCCDYITPYKKNITYHFEKKHKCNCSTLLSYDDAKILSISKRYNIHFDISKLIKDDFIYIVNHYTNQLNYIYEDFKKDEKKKLIQVKEVTQVEEVKEVKKVEITANVLINECFDQSINRFVCPDCKSTYKQKKYLVSHFKNEKTCAKRETVYKKLTKHKENSDLLKTKESIQNEKNKKHFIQNNINQNIQNIHNNNANTQNNTYNLSMKDFVHESYDLTHIKDSFYQRKDFFIYSNFLQAIMENKKNQNIFFSENEAIIYSDNELNKMSSDKAGYLVLDKLSQSFNQLMYKQDDESREFYAFVTKYYSVLKGQYKHDTIFKDYDIDEKRFVYTSNSALFRSRDKYMAKIMTTVNKFNDGARENMNLHIQDIKNIPTINPNIEDYASVRMRYRDLRD
jgi:hypothetical protein